MNKLTNKKNLQILNIIYEKIIETINLTTYFPIKTTFT